MAAARSIDWIGLGITYSDRNHDMQSVLYLARVRRHGVAPASLDLARRSAHAWQFGVCSSRNPGLVVERLQTNYWVNPPRGRLHTLQAEDFHTA